ncbi:hypothetical protein [Desulfotruncus alcoholivorax]|uniref:hypothetical protein n=1 Tax=Desulfotruncus alcoholivorax TaxID=265477 RepID=UPI00040FF823|nr:hypothetical protein [Desulfotruncus alcoholivorax]
MATNDTLIEQLAGLSPDELEYVLEALKKRLEKNKQLKVAEQIIDRYKPALKELAK